MPITITLLLILAICGILTQTPQIETFDPNEVDAEIILPNGIPTEFFTKSIEIETKPEPISDLMDLQNFLINDTTDHHEYIPSGENMYICVHFATDLAQNLTEAGYSAGIVVRSAKWHNRGTGHLLTWCNLNGSLFAIESMNDHVMISDDYNATINTDIYVSRYESLESGYRKVNEMYNRR